MSIQPYWRKPGTTTAFNNASPAAPQSVLGTDDHLQLLGMLDDMFGQLCGGGGIFWLLLLAGKAVVVVEAQDPPSLQKGRRDGWGDRTGSLTNPQSQHLPM